MYTYYNMELETTAGRRVPAEFALIFTLIYTILIAQLGGLIVPQGIKVNTKAPQLDNYTVQTEATKIQAKQEIGPASGISEFIDEVPIAKVDLTAVNAGIIEFIDDAPIAKADLITTDAGIIEFIDDIPIAEAEEIDPPQQFVTETPVEPTVAEESTKIHWEEGMPFPENSFSEETNIKLAVLIEGEAKGQESLTEFSAPGWVVVNRTYFDECPDDIEGVIAQKGQFDGYTEGGTYSERSLWMAHDILARYDRELAGEEEVGRTLPKDYIFFYGDGEHNYFSVTEGGAAYVWGSECESPYES